MGIKPVLQTTHNSKHLVCPLVSLHHLPVLSTPDPLPGGMLVSTCLPAAHTLRPVRATEYVGAILLLVGTRE